MFTVGCSPLAGLNLFQIEDDLRGFPVLRSESVSGREFSPKAYSVFGSKLIATVPEEINHVHRNQSSPSSRKSCVADTLSDPGKKFRWLKSNCAAHQAIQHTVCVKPFVTGKIQDNQVRLQLL